MIKVIFAKKLPEPCVPGLSDPIPGGEYTFNEDDLPGMDLEKSTQYAIGYALELLKTNPNVEGVDPRDILIGTLVM